MALISTASSSAGTSLTSTGLAQTNALDANVNAPNVAERYRAVFNGRTILAPRGVKQIGSFAFDYKGSDIVTLVNDVTDHWLEDNTAAHDHIGVKPIVVTLNGFVSELAVSSDLLAKLSGLLNSIQTTLVRVTNYTGNYSPGALLAMQRAISQAQNIAVQAEQAVARANQLLSLFQNGPAMTKQQDAYYQLSSLSLARVVFTVYTPFQVFHNMVITGLRATQTDKTRTMSDFTVTLKQLNFVGGTFQGYIDWGGRAAQNKQSRFSNGSTAGKSIGTSAVNAVTSAVKGSFPLPI